MNERIPYKCNYYIDYVAQRIVLERKVLKQRQWEYIQEGNQTRLIIGKGTNDIFISNENRQR